MTIASNARGGWFDSARYGLFIHWGPYSAIGRGEQALFRDYMDHNAYEQAACAWNPKAFDPAGWAKAAVAGGFKYVVLTARHHDGYCLWDSQTTDYTSVRQAPKRDFVGEYVQAMRAAGLRVGLYYSLADWRVPGYWSGEGFGEFCDYVHAQVAELLSNYGQIDVLWFDGAWPHSAAAWRSEELIATIRRLQPGILVNNRLDSASPVLGLIEAAGESRTLGDFGTPEHTIVADKSRIWESCQTSVSRLWGIAHGEHWRPTWALMDMLCEAAAKGGNLLLNVGPDSDGRLPAEFLERSAAIGRWLARNGEAIYGTQPGDVTEFILSGYQTVRGKELYLILRFWHPELKEIRIPHLQNQVISANWLDREGPLKVRREDDVTIIELTARPNDRVGDDIGYPVIKVTCDGPPVPTHVGRQRLWQGDPRAHAGWAMSRKKQWRR